MYATSLRSLFHLEKRVKCITGSLNAWCSKWRRTSSSVSRSCTVVSDHSLDGFHRNPSSNPSFFLPVSTPSCPKTAFAHYSYPFSLIRVLVNSLLPHEENSPAHFVCLILPIPVEHKSFSSIALIWVFSLFHSSQRATSVCSKP